MIYDENGNIIGLPSFEPVPQHERPYNYNAEDVIERGWAGSQSYSSNAFNVAMGFLSEIAEISQQITDIPDVAADLIPSAATLTPIEVPDLPARPATLDLSLPDAPQPPLIGDVAALDVGSPPDFAATSPDVDLSIPVPAPFSESLPVAPELGAVALPDAPEFALPDLPTLIAIDLPAAPALNLPEFAATLSDAPLAPDLGTFSFTEERYTSELLTSLREVLHGWIVGASTGIAPEVERAIWNRAREREAGATQRKLREISRDFARRGFNQPQGALSVALSDALQEIQHRDAELSREVAIKQADLEQTNRRFAFEQTWQVESGLINYANQIAQRAFEASKFALQVALEVFQAQVAQYDAQVKAFGVRAEVFKTLLQGELAKLDVFKAQIEAQKLVGELNVQAIQAYQARVESLKALIEVYKTRVQAAGVVAEINKTAIEAYGARVAAYESTVKAKAAEYDGYATRVKAEVSKVEVFRAQADAYRSQVEGFAALVGAKTAEKNIELKIKQEAPIDLFKARTEAFRTQVGAETERVRAVTSLYEADANVFSTQVQAQAARAGAEATIYRAESDVAVAGANVRIEAAKATIAKLVQQVGLLSENVRAGAQVAAQLAASAMSQFNYSSGMSVSEAFNTSNSNTNAKSSSDSFSISINKNIDD